MIVETESGKGPVMLSDRNISEGECGCEEFMEYIYSVAFVNLHSPYSLRLMDRSVIVTTYTADLCAHELHSDIAGSCDYDFVPHNGIFNPHRASLPFSVISDICACLHASYMRQI